MGSRYIWFCSAILPIFLAYNCPVNSELVASQCVHSREDFDKSNWEDYSDGFNWAESGNDLPPDFVGKLVGQQEDVFYFDLTQSSNANPYLENDFSWARYASHAYIYIRYYAHSESSGPEFYLTHSAIGGIHYLQPAIDFKWKEACLDIIPSSQIEIGAVISDFSTESFFFIDTIMFLQGNDVLGIEDALAICPARQPATTTPPTDVTTDSSTVSVSTSDTSATTSDSTASTSNPTASVSESTDSTSSISSTTPAVLSTSYYTNSWVSSTTSEMDSTVSPESTSSLSSTFPSTTNQIPTAPPSDPALECINNNNDFNSLNWQSYPFHQYAEDSASLPTELQGRLNASGIFYLEGSLRYEDKTFFKDYHASNDWGSIPTYLYLKYSAFTISNNSQVLYARPVQTSSTDPIEDLSLGTGDTWEETVLSIEVTIEEMKTVEIGMRNFQAGEYLLVDKIAVVRADNLFELLRLIESCADE